MNHVSFGSVLKEARIRKGYEPTTVARRLRIRPDILQAIENSDFASMPPSGYTRNMISAYARLLDIDSNEVTRMYLDEVYAYRVGRAYSDIKQNRYQNRNTSTATSRPSSNAVNTETSSWSRNRATPNASGLNSFGRRMYSSRDELPHFEQPSNKPQASHELHRHADQQLRRSRRPVITEGKYGNLVSSAPSNYTKKSKVPFVIAGVAVILLLIIFFGVSSCSKGSEEQQNIPVTGVESKKEAEEQTVKETAPTDFTFAYTVDKDSSAWIEVYIDDEVKEAGEVTGPSSQEYKCSSKLEFVAGSPEGVSVTINGEKQTISANENGIVSVTFSFDDILDKWYEAHPDVKKPSTSDSAAKAKTTSNSSTTNSDSSSSSSTSSSE